MTPERFHDLLSELVDENPFAIRPFIKMVGVRFTETIPTMSVTREARPELLVNLAFIQAHCQSDAEVKAVILHEFLHILLRHTEGRGPLCPAEHLAMDAVINAIIHRQVGSSASGMMARYYGKARGLKRLLRPPLPKEIPEDSSNRSILQNAWKGLYEGRLVVDDIRELSESLAPNKGTLLIDLNGLLGNHHELGKPIPTELQEILHQALRTMNGGGIWRSPKDRGLGITAYESLVVGNSQGIRAWERTAMKVLQDYLQPDKRSRASHQVSRTSLLPVLSPADRRAFLQTLWSPILPTARWDFLIEQPIGTAQIYLDVSGSMNAEMPLVIGLLNRLRRFIRMPFWAFSTHVAPARIEAGVLKTDTTGGTSLACVLDHISKTRPESAVIVTDGYIEAIPHALVGSTSHSRIHALVTRDGSPSELDRAGLSYTQLPKVPQ